MGYANESFSSLPEDFCLNAPVKDETSSSLDGGKFFSKFFK